MKNQILNYDMKMKCDQLQQKNKKHSFVNVKDILLSVCILHLSLSSKTFQ